MAPLQLEGDNLGQKHKHYNQLVKQAVEQNQGVPLLSISYEDNDIENMMKIDIASKYKNLEFILKVLKCEDMLYVSRAIKLCTWLFTEPEYAHIINPQYLYTELFPDMTVKARNKLLLQIRLKLKNEQRVDDFFNFYKNNDLDIALKWLPNCSLAVIEKAVEAHCSDMRSERIFTRICKKSITILDVYVRKCNRYRQSILEATICLVKSHPEKYLDIVESCYEHEFPKFGPKHVQFIMKKCPERIINNFEKYYSNIDSKALAGCLKREEIKSFLIKQVENKKIRRWLSFENMKHFIKRLPKEGRFEFIKNIFIDKIDKEDNIQDDTWKCEQDVAMCCAMERDSPSTSANIYRWYQFAPFHIAMIDLKKLIRAESLPEERCNILTVLLTSAARNQQDVETLLKFYHEKHINEPFKFKNQFINNVIAQTQTHRYNNETWNVLNELFHCMEVYIESNNNVQNCIQTIITYKVLHDETIPEIIEKKFEFNSLKKIQKKLNDIEKGKIFKYLHDFIKRKVDNAAVTNQTQANETIELLKKAFTLLSDWKKDILQYPWILDKVKQLVEIKRMKTLDIDLLSIYNMNKSWRKHMFVDSLVINPCEETTLNALKHKHNILLRDKTELDTLTSNDSLVLKQFLNKLRIYYCSTLAIEITQSYQNRLKQTKGHRAIVCGLCILLQQPKLRALIEEYAPSECKINWSETDEILLSLQKHIARNMYLARPQPVPDLVLMYAKGSYLQFVIPSLNSIFHNLSPAESRECIPKLLDAPVSLQKHGIRLAFEKLKTEETKKIITDIWKTNKNSSIRTVLFKLTFDLICKEKQSSVIQELWEVLSMFIDNLNADEGRIIYHTLGKVKDVPESIRGAFCQKSYLCLKSQPVKTNCKNIITRVLSYMPEIIELLDNSFVESILLDFIDNKFTKEKNDYQYDDIMHLMAAYILSSKNEESSLQKYEKVICPLMSNSFSLWGSLIEGEYYIRSNLKSTLMYIKRTASDNVFKKNFVIPIKVLSIIQQNIEEALPLEENYKLLRRWKIFVALIKSLQNPKVKEIKENSSDGSGDKWRAENERWEKAWQIIIPDVAEVIKNFLIEDINAFYPGIYKLFSKSLKEVFEQFNISDTGKIAFSKAMLEKETSVEICLLVFKLLPRYGVEDKDKEKLNEVRKILFSYPSAEVKMKYFEIFDKPEKGVELPE